MKPIIHFAHANGVPAQVYTKLFKALEDDFDVIYVPLLGPDRRYPIDNHWHSLTQQVIDSIVRQAKGRPVIGIGHSLGAVLTFKAAQQRPELFSQLILMDPPFVTGTASLMLHVVKTLKLKLLDKLSPAGLSKNRRDHWESREQAATSLGAKGFYKDFDPECFQHYIDYALTEDRIRGGVELSISKYDEVKMFNTNPSWYWLPQPKTKVPAQLLVPKGSPFLQHKFPQQVSKKFAILLRMTEGGHMFPLERPLEVATLLKQLVSTTNSQN